MDTKVARSQVRMSKLGWGILLVVSFLFILNGATWFFVGPTVMMNYVTQIGGAPLSQMIQNLTPVAAHFARNTRQVAILDLAFGLMAFIVTLEGYRYGSRWAWIAAWMIVIEPALIGLLYLPGVPLAFDNLGMFLFAAVALAGQLLAYRGLSTD